MRIGNSHAMQAILYVLLTQVPYTQTANMLQLVHHRCAVPAPLHRSRSSMGRVMGLPTTAQAMEVYISWTATKTSLGHILGDERHATIATDSCLGHTVRDETLATTAMHHVWAAQSGKTACYHCSNDAAPIGVLHTSLVLALLTQRRGRLHRSGIVYIVCFAVPQACQHVCLFVCLVWVSAT